MLLRQGDRGDAVKAFQRNLNKLGTMLLIDGDFGPGTRHAVVQARDLLGQAGPPEADDALQAAVANSPDPCPPLTAAGMTFIAREEVSNAATYQQRFQRPVWPGGASGVTIGIGYDCRFVNRGEFTADWAGVLAPDAIDQMAAVLGLQGSHEQAALVSRVEIPLGRAMRVFAARSLPKHLDETKNIYPQIVGPALTPAQRTALVSLVYNRGADLRGDRRREMLAIQQLLATGRINDVPAQFESMTRLWNPGTEGGLIRRRRAEATMWQSGFGGVGLD